VITTRWGAVQVRESSVTHSLETAGFQRLELITWCDASWDQSLRFKWANLHRYTAAHPAGPALFLIAVADHVLIEEVAMAGCTS
jgi:hypothetical protein